VITIREPYPPSIIDVKNVRLKPFSRVFSHNFRFPRAAMFFLLLVESAFKNWSMETTCNISNNSSDRYFYYVGQMTVDEITDYCNRLLLYAFRVLWTDRRYHKPVFLAIDTTDLSCSANNPEYRHSTLKKKGLKLFSMKVIRYATLSLVMREFRLTIAVLPVRRGEKMEETVDKLIRLIPRGLKVRALLLDKGFYHVGVMKTVEQHGLHYVIPVKRYGEMDLHYHIAELTGAWRFTYTMNKGTGREYSFNVYLEDLGVEHYTGFASNLSMTDRDFFTLIRAYSYRWNIEVGYKEALEYAISSSTRRHGHRVVIFTISHLLMNLQSIINKDNPVDGLTIHYMKEFVFPCLSTLRHGVKRMGKRFILVY
jgi:hypothetical protein